MGSYPKFLEGVECLQGKLCEEVVEEAEGAEAVVDAHEDQWIQPLDDIPLQVESGEAVEAVEGPHPVLTRYGHYQF